MIRCTPRPATGRNRVGTLTCKRGLTGTCTPDCYNRIYWVTHVSQEPAAPAALSEEVPA